MRAAPYLVSFDCLEDYYRALSKSTLIAHEQEIDRLIEKGFPPIASIRCLAVLFGFSPKFIGSLLNKTDRHYRLFEIKKGKKKRQIEAPKVGLKVIQKWIAEHLSKTVHLEDCVHGFVPGRSYITAAKKHVNANWVYSVDIENFFQSTSLEKVRKIFLELGYPERGADIASKLCCYNGHLAQGSPASPVLSNLIFTHLDKTIGIKISQLDINYTRYADDLVFSGKNNFPDQVKEVKALIEAQGWKIAEKKEHFSELPNRLKVHGLLVHGNKIRLTKGYRNKIRAFKHLIDAGVVTGNDLARMSGHINMSNNIDRQA